MKTSLPLIKYLGCLLTLFSLSVSASVTLVGTRVIYPGDAKFVNLQFRSPDAVPSIMEVWTSLNDTPDSSSQNADAPFVPTPQVFRIEPKKGQTVKLTYTGANLPQDRESVFYLNFVQLPAMKKETQSKNKLLVTYKSTVKVFYRPGKLIGDPHQVSSQLKLDASRLSSGSVKITNPTAYYATISNLDFKQNGKTVLSVNGNDIPMIAPFSEQKISVKPMKSNASKTIVTINTINDMGGISASEVTL